MGNLLNQAFIDGQNLHMATAKAKRPWNIDFVRFRKYSTQKYNVDTAYFFLGYAINDLEALYKKLGSEFYDFLDRADLKNRLKKRKVS